MKMDTRGMGGEEVRGSKVVKVTRGWTSVYEVKSNTLKMANYLMHCMPIMPNPTKWDTVAANMDRKP